MTGLVLVVAVEACAITSGASAAAVRDERTEPDESVDAETLSRGGFDDVIVHLERRHAVAVAVHADVACACASALVQST